MLTEEGIHSALSLPTPSILPSLHIHRTLHDPRPFAFSSSINRSLKPYIALPILSQKCSNPTLCWRTGMPGGRGASGETQGGGGTSLLPSRSPSITPAACCLFIPSTPASTFCQRVNSSSCRPTPTGLLWAAGNLRKKRSLTRQLLHACPFVLVWPPPSEFVLVTVRTQRTCLSLPLAPSPASRNLSCNPPRPSVPLVGWRVVVGLRRVCWLVE